MIGHRLQGDWPVLDRTVFAVPATTDEGRLVSASEVGVLNIPEENILLKERLHPGRIFLIDTEQGRIIADEEIKRELASQHPYGEWLRENMVALEDLTPAPLVPLPDHYTMVNRQRTFGYTQEDLNSAGADGPERRRALGSMGTDTALACCRTGALPTTTFALSRRSRSALDAIAKSW